VAVYHSVDARISVVDGLVHPHLGIGRYRCRAVDNRPSIGDVEFDDMGTGRDGAWRIDYVVLEGRDRKRITSRKMAITGDQREVIENMVRCGNRAPELGELVDDISGQGNLQIVSTRLFSKR